VPYPVIAGFGIEKGIGKFVLYIFDDRLKNLRQEEWLQHWSMEYPLEWLRQRQNIDVEGVSIKAELIEKLLS
jgi:hypothetical protein